MNFKKIFALSLIPILLMLNFSVVSAKNVALAVKDVNNLNPIYEQRLYDILTSMNNVVTLVDQNSNVDYHTFDLLVVAGRPSTASPLPQSFAQNLPVNSMPTIAIDYYNLYFWGWVDSGGVNVMSSGSLQSFYVASNTHPITSGYLIGQRVFFQNVSGLDAIDLVAGTSNFTFVAYLDQQGDGAIAFAAPNTRLTNGKSIGANSVAIFLGTMFPGYWTNDMENIFRNAVNWITNINYTPPTVPTLSGPTQTILNSALYSWTSATGANGIQNYEVQVSTTSDFSAIIVDTKISGLSYNLNKMLDGQRYYVRVRAIDYLNLPSSWSNVISTIADFTPIILTMTSPTNGATLQLGQTVFVNVVIDAPRVQAGSVCTIKIDQDTIGTLLFNQTTSSCSGDLILPSSLSPGSSTATFSVSIPDQFGATNSTSISVYIPGRQQIPSTTTTTTSTTTETSLQNTGSSGSSSSYALLSVNSPKNLSYYVDSQNTFTISVKNSGNMILHYVKVTLASHPALAVAFTPTDTFDLNPGESKIYSVTVQTPNLVGTYNLFVKSLSLETVENTRTIPVIVTEKPILVDFGITSIEIPDFVDGVASFANISIINKGNVVGTANVKLDLPEGWTVASPTANVDIVPNQEAKLSFEITPSILSGNIIFSGDFTAGNITKTFSYPVPVSSKSVDSLSALTASLAATLGNPAVAIPTTIAIAVVIALYYKFKTQDFNSNYIWPKRAKASYGTVTPKSNQKNNFQSKKPSPSARSMNNAYEKWERSRR